MAAPKVTQKYAFTVTLLPKCFRKNAEDQFDATHEVLCEMLKKISNRYSIVAELTKNCNIHYHGIIDFRMSDVGRNVIKYFKDKFRNHSLFGYVDIKVITNEVKWVDYIRKDIKVTYESIGRRPIMHDDFDVLGDYFQMYGFDADADDADLIDADSIDADSIDAD